MDASALQRWAASSEYGLVYRLTTDEYDRLVAAGLRDSHRVELLDGLLAWKPPEGPGYARAVAAASDRLGRLLPAGFIIRESEPVPIPPFDQHDADLAIVRGKRLRDAHDVQLIVAFADSRHEADRDLKGFAYASASIPAYWRVNLGDRQVEVLSDPQGGAYQSSTTFLAGELVPLTIDGERIGRIDVADLLG